MANTRITQGVIKPNEDYDVRHINATGIITAPTVNVSAASKTTLFPPINSNEDP